MTDVKPLTPQEVGKLKMSSIPPEVIEAFNELIAKDFDGKEATVYLDTVVKLICSKMKIDSKIVYHSDWLNIEDLFRKYGWKVKYDSPAYCESYAAFYVFYKK